MKRIIHYVFIFSCLAFFIACSNGNYTANPNSNLDNSINPLHPLKGSDFTWSGEDPVSADINGTHWVAAGYFYNFHLGTNQIIAYSSSGPAEMVLTLNDPWAGTVYSMGYHEYKNSAYWTDNGNTDVYNSSQGNSGGLWTLEYDSAYVKGLFYFQGINNEGVITNVLHGYFNISRN